MCKRRSAARGRQLVLGRRIPRAEGLIIFTFLWNAHTLKAFFKTRACGGPQSSLVNVRFARLAQCFALLLKKLFTAANDTATTIGTHHFDTKLGARTTVASCWTAAGLRMAQFFILIVPRLGTFVSLLFQRLSLGADGLTRALFPGRQRTTTIHGSRCGNCMEEMRNRGSFGIRAAWMRILGDTKSTLTLIPVIMAPADNHRDLLWFDRFHVAEYTAAHRVVTARSSIRTRRVWHKSRRGRAGAGTRRAWTKRAR